jgi:hypothetical protein
LLRNFHQPRTFSRFVPLQSRYRILPGCGRRSGGNIKINLDAAHAFRPDVFAGGLYLNTPSRARD